MWNNKIVCFSFLLFHSFFPDESRRERVAVSCFSLRQILRIYFSRSLAYYSMTGCVVIVFSAFSSRLSLCGCVCVCLSNEMRNRTGTLETTRAHSQFRLRVVNGRNTALSWYLLIFLVFPFFLSPCFSMFWLNGKKGKIDEYVYIM